MGLGGIGVWQLLIILLIVFMLFGTKKLRSLGADLGGALKGFKTAIKDDGESETKADGDDAATEQEASATGDETVATAEKVDRNV